MPSLQLLFTHNSSLNESMSPQSNKIGLLGATAYVTCTIIGSGIFVSPKGILMHSGSIGLALIIWIISAGIAGITALSYIELATSIPECGCDFAYISYVKWKPLAFAFLWLSNVIEGSCSAAILFMTFGKYIAQTLDPLELDLSEMTKFRLEQLLGVACLMALGWVNFYSLRRWASRIQIIMMAMKLLSLGLIIVTGAVYLGKGHTQNFTHGRLFEGSKWHVGEICLAIYSGNWAYAGWECLNYGTEEIDPKKFSKIVPRAVIGGLGLASFIYVLANIAYFVALNPQQLLDADAVATAFAEKTLGNFYYAMPAIVGTLMIGTLNSDIFQYSRLMMAGARKNLMPSMLSLVDVANDSPRVSVLFHMLLGIAFSFFKDVDTLLDYINVAGMLRELCAVGALLYIKWYKMPVSEKAVKFSILIPLATFIIVLALIVVPFAQDIVEAGASCGALIICIAAYFIFIYPSYRSSILQWIDRKSVYIFKRLLLCVASDQE